MKADEADWAGPAGGRDSQARNDVNPQAMVLIALLPSATVLFAGCIVAIYRTITRDGRQVGWRGGLAVSREDRSIVRRLGDHPDRR